MSIRVGDHRYLDALPITVIGFVNAGKVGERIQYVTGHVQIGEIGLDEFLPTKYKEASGG